LPERSQERAGSTRSFWSGTITFGLVSIPVDLFAAVRGRQTAMKMVDEKGHALGRQYFCPKDEKKLSSDEIVRGYETESGKMLVITDEELESVAPEMTRDIELRRFVPLDQIPPSYYQHPYFLAPSGRSSKAYHLLAETMEATARVGIGSFVMRGHEYLVAIISEGGLLRAETLRFADELRSPSEIGLPKRGKSPAKRINEFAKAISKLTRNALDLDELSDHYADAISKLVAAKEKEGKDIVKTLGADSDDGESASADVIDLMKVLRQRLAAGATVTTAREAHGVPKSSGNNVHRLPGRTAQSREQTGRTKAKRRAKR
jgi:DNA end-binding protein Ku